jgi:hypothetical protein
MKTLLQEAIDRQKEREQIDEIIIRNCCCDIDERTVYTCFEAVEMAMKEYYSKKKLKLIK